MYVYFHMCKYTFPGRVPILAWTSDQGLFPSWMYMAACGVAVAHFPDVNHQESNIDATLLNAVGLGMVDEKTLFLARLKHGPMREAGHWGGQLKEALQAPSAHRVRRVNDAACKPDVRLGQSGRQIALHHGSDAGIHRHIGHWRSSR